ncbi:hypothetical protein PAXRUDRAFT_834730, partial [Paxillus rubicundulus Ve08.2h10]
MQACPIVVQSIYNIHCLGTVGYSQPRLTKTCTTQASQLSADLWPVVVGYRWAE